MFDKLLKEVNYAKSSLSARDMLFQAYGKITLARELDLITCDEYLELNRLCVREGINNPKYFR